MVHRVIRNYGAQWSRRDLDTSCGTRGGVLDGVGYQIHPYHAQQWRIAFYDRQVVDLPMNIAALAEMRQLFANFIDDLIERNRLRAHLDAAGAGKCQQVVDE